MKLQGALIGAGNIALKSHAPQWARDERLREEVDIVAVADLSPSNLEAVRQILPGVRCYSLAEDLLERETLDFCDICTPPFTHRPLVESVARRGIHIVCEKPLAPSVEDAEGIVAAVRRASIAFQPCHQYHYSPQWLAVKAFLPRIGRVYFAEYEVQRTSANPGNANWTPAWRTDKAMAGGGILADHGAHIFYQLAAVLGEPVTVQATVRTLKHSGYQVEDTALVTLDYGHALANVRLSWAAQSRRIHFRFVGELGELVGDDDGLQIHAGTSEEVTFDKGMSQNSSHAEWYAPLFTGFVERVRANDTGSAALDEAVLVSRLIARAYESSAVGRSLPLATESLVEAGLAESMEQALVSLEAAETATPAAAADPETPTVRSGLKKGGRILRWAGLSALLAVLVWAFYDIQWSSVGHSLAGAKLGWLALAAGVNLLVVLFQSARWLALVRPLSRAATLAEAFKATLVGFAVSTVVPARAGELARVEWIGRATGLSRVSVIGTVLLDQLVNAAVLLTGVALLPLLGGVPLWLRSSGYFALGLFVIGAAIVVVLKPVQMAPGPQEATRSRMPLRYVANVIARVRHGLLASRDPRALGWSFGASSVAWALEIVVTAVSMRAVGLHLPLIASILVLVAVNLALAFPVATPGNVGTLELGATLALLEFGVPKGEALAFAVCYHLLQVVPIGIIGFVLLSRRVAPTAALASPAA
jgi:glycosyltransferase AglD